MMSRVSKRMTEHAPEQQYIPCKVKERIPTPPPSIELHRYAKREAFAAVPSRFQPQTICEEKIRTVNNDPLCGFVCAVSTSYPKERNNHMTRLLLLAADFTCLLMK
jgi:hypothetical protein